MIVIERSTHDVNAGGIFAADKSVVAVMLA